MLFNKVFIFKTGYKNFVKSFENCNYASRRDKTSRRFQSKITLARYSDCYKDEYILCGMDFNQKMNILLPLRCDNFECLDKIF